MHALERCYVEILVNLAYFGHGHIVLSSSASSKGIRESWRS